MTTEKFTKIDMVVELLSDDFEMIEKDADIVLDTTPMTPTEKVRLKQIIEANK